MQISRNWLADYLDLSGLSAADYSELVTTKVAEVDGTETAGEPLEWAIAALIKKAVRHPKKENLKVCTIATGAGDVEVVCGAPNCREGLLTAYLPVGAKALSLHGPVTVEARAFDGCVSNGVLVSEQELGVSADHN